MTSNADASEVFRTIADLLDLLGEKFKPEAYRRAARSIESMTEELRAVSARGELRSIPGVGEAIAEKIEELLTTGSVHYYERLKREVPPGLVELMRLPGLGPKTARRFWVELGIEGPNELRDAIAMGRLHGVKGFGEKKIGQIQSALAAAAAGPGPTRRSIEEVYPVARSLVRTLRETAPVDRVEVAGSFRRSRETVGDLDILVTSQDPAKVFEVFTAHALVADVKMRGETKETVLLTGGLQVDLRVVKPEEFGAALQYFTGSKDHNVRLRSLARDRGLKVNEYGVFRGDERVAGATEEEVYATLGLAWIPPELREDHGEIDAAARGPFPVLVGEGDVKGDLHVHLPSETAASEVDRVLADACSRHLEYVGVVVGGLARDGTPWRLADRLLDRLAHYRVDGLRILRAIETDRGPVPSVLDSVAHDYTILRPTARPSGTPGASDFSRPPRVVGHVGPGTTSDADPLSSWLDLAATLGAAVEVGPGTERVDSVGGRVAHERNLRLHLPTGVGGSPDDPTMSVAVGFARRAGATSSEVVNARPGGELVSRATDEPTRSGRSRGHPTGRSANRRSS